jgi:excisionase family DNA binding protein
METSELLTTKEAADFLRLSPAVIHKLKQDGQLPFVQIRRKVFYRKSALLAMIEEHEVGKTDNTAE